MTYCLTVVIRQVLATKFDHVMVPIRTKPLHSKDTELLLMISMWDWSCESGEAVFIHPNSLVREFTFNFIRLPGQCIE